ncbi:MAG: FAD-binding oxidoreductase [Cytophagales bacterium]|nr:FAD-binding oxidoreductase [Armatimonadota bacterium]
MGYVYRPTTADGIRDVLTLAREKGLQVAPRGGGNSYGDAATAREHLVLDLTRMNRILHWDPETGVIRVEPGVTIRQMWQQGIGDGWWPPVVSGTMLPTLGGAAAMNIHGKNHFRAGVLGDHILHFDLLLPATGEVVRCSRQENPDLFFAALGGFGVLGVFTEIRLRLRKVHSGLLHANQHVAGNLAEMFERFEALTAQSDYAVGWIDGFAKGEALGRGLVQTGQHLAPGEDPRPAQTLRVASQELPDTLLGFFPKSVVWRLMKPWMNDFGMRTLNALRYHKSRLIPAPAHTETHAGFQFMLDYIPHWKRAYGAHGLIQYQCQVPDTAAREVFREILALCQHRGLISYLIVFKRHRADNEYLMSYSVDGWSLALDFKVTTENRERLWSLAAEMDRIVLGSGGRFYFAKDSTLHPDRLQSFLGEERVQRFLALKRRVDPENLLQTDLYRRLFTGAADTTVEAPLPSPLEIPR